MKLFIIVITLSLGIACANSIQFFSALASQPHGTVYLGTVHYYEDYFFYLNHFFQGAHGGWLTKNQFTSEVTSPSILYWSNIFMGKSGSLLGLSPIISYNVSLLLVAFATILTSYFLLLFLLKDTKKAFIGFLFTNFATSFMNHIYVDGKPMWYPFQLWRTPHFAFDRLGGVPHQILQTLLFYLLILTYFSKNQKVRWLAVPAAFLLMTINPVPAGLFVFFAWLLELHDIYAFVRVTRGKLPSFARTNLAKLHGYLQLFALSVASIVTLVLLQPTLNSLPHLQSKIWEAGQQPTTQLWFLLMSIGPISIFYLAGIFPTAKKYGTIGVLAATIPVVCYTLFFTKIPQIAGFSNLRIIFPGLYILMGATAVEGLYGLSRLLNNLISKAMSAQKSKLQKPDSLNRYSLFLVITFLIFSLFTIQWEVRQKTMIADDVKIPFVYMPVDMYRGFEELAKILPYDDVVLANPTSHVDILVPALSGHTTYSGHFLTTIDNGEKVTKAQKFFAFAYLPPEARAWLIKEKITYVVVTNFDRNGNQLSKFYPFLKQIISTPSFSAYQVN